MYPKYQGSLFPVEKCTYLSLFKGNSTGFMEEADRKNLKGPLIGHIKSTFDTITLKSGTQYNEVELNFESRLCIDVQKTY